VRRDSMLVSCQPNAQGICRGHHVVFSQITRVGERDALVIVQSIRAPASVTRLLVKLRYRRGGWAVSDFNVIM
ncbi:MAG TPA: hypothetical protein VHG09_11345, partial [Longimicrobiales bacterium]|nr:hypothetical protein [Longimicrobiales bacterium]